MMQNASRAWKFRFSKRPTSQGTHSAHRNSCVSLPCVHEIGFFKIFSDFLLITIAKNRRDFLSMFLPWWGYYGHIIIIYHFNYSDSGVAAAGAALSNSRRFLHERWYLPIFRDCRWTGMQVSKISPSRIIIFNYNPSFHITHTHAYVLAALKKCEV